MLRNLNAVLGMMAAVVWLNSGSSNSLLGNAGTDPQQSPSLLDATADSPTTTPAATNRHEERHADRLVDATKTCDCWAEATASQAAAVDKRCCSLTTMTTTTTTPTPTSADAADHHHQSNDLAISREEQSAENPPSSGPAEQQPLQQQQQQHDENGKNAKLSRDVKLTARQRHRQPDDAANNYAGARPESKPAAADVKDSDDDAEADDDTDGITVSVDEEMQNDQAAFASSYRAPGGGGGGGEGGNNQPYYGNLRRQPPPPLSPTAGQPQSRPDDFNIEYTREIVIKQGRLRGMVRTMHAQSGLRNCNQFLGIPYAAAPVGSGRFMPPGAPPPWPSAKVFTSMSPVCPQNLPQINGSAGNGGGGPMAAQIAAGRYDQLKRLLPFLRNENEDCLFLNLYAPQVDATTEKLPVIVFVHGESYEWNSGNPYDGSVLASYGQVVVVTLNYRLGILGFLKPGTGDHTVSNFGLLDQIAALQWVKDNIAAFGGNNRAVTLMGHGTGAACVNLLMLSPVARGLFHRAILMSGSALSDWAIAQHPLPTTMQVVQGINCPLRDDNEEILQCLRKKRYQEILQQRTSVPEYGTVFGPVVDNLVVPNQPYKIMSQYNEMFSRYDLLFGMTEIESYHNLNAVGLAYGLLESERDSYLRLYMQNRYEIRPDIALALTLQEYADLYANPERPLAGEHRDTVLEILSDARIAAPLLQTGLFHSKVNPRSYMYVFGHNSRAGEYANHPQSIVGEDLPYVFGAPLASTTPFPSKYSPEERLLSESIMVAWTNFAKTGNPKAPSRDHYLNLEPKDWERYDIDWPEFNAANMNYLNIGIPPVVNQKYRYKYMQYWNQALPMELNRTLSMKPLAAYPSEQHHRGSFGTSIHPAANHIRNSNNNGGSAHINYYPDKTTEDPFRTLKLLLNRNNLNDHSEMYNTQSTVVTATIIDNGSPYSSPESINDQQQQANVLLDGQQIIVKADATLNILIAVIVGFLLLNAIAIGVYLVRRYYQTRSVQSKLDVLTLDGGNTDADTDAKRSKFCGDGDESFMLDTTAAMRKQKQHSNDYETVATGFHSPINGYLLGSDISSSTVDAHTKVSDWMCQEIINGDMQQQHKKKSGDSPSFSLKSRGFFRRSTKPTEVKRRTPEAILEHSHLEYAKPKSNDTIICQDIDVDTSLIDGSIDLRECSRSIPSLRGAADGLRIDHRHSRSDPVQMYYRRAPAPDEDITFFIEDPAMHSTRDDSVERPPLSAEDALATIRMRNYPKVLPRVPDDTTEYVSSALIKRRSLPPQYFSMNPALRMPPTPPVRTTSTLGRGSKRDSNFITTSPIMVAEEPPEPAAEPETTCNVLHVGPLLPKSTESIYSTVTRTPRSPLRTVTPQFTFENCVTIESGGGGGGGDSASTASTVTCEPAVHRPSGMRPPSGYNKSTESLSKMATPPRVAMRPSLLRQTSADSHSHRMSVQSIAEEDVRTTSPPPPSAQPLTGKVISSRIPQAKQRNATLDRSASDSSGSSASKSSSSGAETVKQIF